MEHQISAAIKPGPPPAGANAIEAQPSPPWWGRISLLWLMCVPVMVAMYTLCIGIVPHDFWWHARAGGIVAATGRVPTTNLFSSSLPASTPYVYQSWGAELIFYEVMKHGGLAWIMIVRSFCLCSAFAIIIWAAYRRSLRLAHAIRRKFVGTGAALPSVWALENTVARIVAGGALLTLALTAPSMEVRPQIFSVPLFALFIAALLEWPALTHTTESARIPTLAIAALVLTMLLWANLHGAFCTGLIMLGVFCCGEMAYTWWPMRSKSAWWGVPLSKTALYALGGLLLLCVLVAIINPRGLGVYFYVMKLAGDPPSQKYIQEWQSPTWGNVIHDLFFLTPFILAFLANKIIKATKASNSLDDSTTKFPASAWGRFGMRPAELLVLAALAVMTFRDVRSLVWYALLFAPLFSAICTVAIVQAKLRQEADSPGATAPIPSPSLYGVNVVMAIFLLCLIVPELPWVKPYIPLPNSFQDRFAPTPRGQFPNGFSGDPPLLLDRLNPVEAVAYLRQHPPRQRLFTEMGYGSYVIWMLYPRVLVSSDTRVELYPLSFWDDYFRLCKGPRDAPQFMAQHGFSDALLDDKQQAGLIKRLKNAPGWHVVLARGQAVLLHYEK